MDCKGIIFSIDAALALIPLLILFAAITGSSNLSFNSDHVRISHDAQDALEVMANYKSGDFKSTILQNITDTLQKYNNSQEGVALSGEIAGPYLNRTIGGSKYTLIEINQLKGTVIASNAHMKNGTNTAAGIRNCGNYTFKLFIWD